MVRGRLGRRARNPFRFVILGLDPRIHASAVVKAWRWCRIAMDTAFDAKCPTGEWRKGRGMDPRVYASAALPLRPRMTKGGDGAWLLPRVTVADGQSGSPMSGRSPLHLVILGLDPRIHASALMNAKAMQNALACASPDARVRRKRRGMDPRVYASAALPLRPRMTKAGDGAWLSSGAAAAEEAR